VCKHHSDNRPERFSPRLDDCKAKVWDTHAVGLGHPAGIGRIQQHECKVAWSSSSFPHSRPRWRVESSVQFPRGLKLHRKESKHDGACKEGTSEAGVWTSSVVGTPLGLRLREIMQEEKSAATLTPRTTTIHQIPAVEGRKEAKPSYENGQPAVACCSSASCRSPRSSHSSHRHIRL
jgi:hypothetical protein